jgi:trimeric autotransporter adhesin
MKRISLLLAFLCVCWTSYCQTTLVVFAGGSLPNTDSVTGYVRNAGVYTIGKDTITSAGTIVLGYAVFDFSAIPSGSTITSVRTGFYIDSVNTSFGTPTSWKVGGYNGDLSVVTPASTLFTDCSGSTSLYTNSWGTTAHTNHVLPTTVAAQNFVQTNIGAKGSLTYSSAASTGVALYGIRGESAPADTGTSPHCPFLIITYTTACPTISGPDTVCAGSTISLTDTAAGTWISGNPAIATVDSTTGVVTGVTGGTTLISYVEGSCTTTHSVTVIHLNAISPSAGATVCVGAMTDYCSGPSGGTWTSSNTSIATLGAPPSACGHIWGAASGIDTVTYSYAGCSVSMPVTVTGPVAITPVSSTICVGSLDTLTDATSGGTWSSVYSSIATVTSGAGIVTGVSVGTDTVKYTIGSCSVWAVVFVGAGAGTITPAGPSTICVGGTLSLSDATGGGSWASSNGSIASVSPSGVVTGISAGTATISYLVGSCYAVTTVIVAAPPAAISPATATVCVGSNVTFTDASAGGTWSSSTSNASLVSAGVFSGASAGTAVISYAIGSCTAIANLTVNAGPSPLLPSSPSVCSGSNITLTETVSGGVWTSGSTSVATVAGGTVYGVAAGTATISYAIGSCIVSTSVTVTTGPAAISPATSNICLSTTTTFSDASLGGTWSSSNPAIASIVSGGIVDGAAIGAATITYTVGSCSATAAVNVIAPPAAITPSGLISICTSYTTTLGDATSGGTWTISPTTVATINSSGIVTALTGGTATATYSVGSCYVTKSITVTTGPSLISPISLSLCVGSNGIMSDGTPSGAWLTSNAAVATVAGGLVHAVGAGTATISYNVGTCAALATVTVNNAPSSITPSTSSLCVGSTETLTNTTSGGTWSSGSPAIATITSGGLLTALSAGPAVISYSIGSCIATATVTVDVTPTAILPGSTSVCQGSTVTLTDGTAGGAWTSSATAIASISPTGVVSGLSAGTATISYTTSVCSATATVTVNALPNAGVISGSSTSMCTGGATMTLSETVGGGTWSASNAHASVSSTGVVTAVSAGAVTISYAVSNSCSTAYATYTITVNITPVAGGITGTSAICQGSSYVFTDATGTAGGTWNGTTGNATVTTAGGVTGTTAGTDIISYTFTNSCGSVTATFPVTINPLPTVTPITGGAATVCVGAAVTFTDATAGGVWSASNGAASVGVASGIVTGIAGGTDTIFYSVSNSCGGVSSSYVITVLGAPSAGIIGGPSAVCEGATITLTSTISGGSWSSSNGNATVVPGSGAVSGVVPGKDTVTYTLVTGCWTASAVKVVSIDASSGSGTISGPGTVCAGTTITLSDIFSGGTWSRTNAHATVSGAGVVTGVSAGLDTVLYTFTNSCGTLVADYPVSVTLTASAGTITGPSSVCLGSTITLTDLLTGGSWSASNTHASISILGTSIAVNGVSLGTDTISYTTVTSCGIGRAILPVSVTTWPIAGVIGGSSSVCVGNSVTLTETVPGGRWVSGNAKATVDSLTGVVTGVSTGTDTITYNVTNACGTVGAFKIMTISNIPNPGTITGGGAICVGSTTPLTDPVPGGTWSASNADASVVGGLVTGLSGGVTNISYTLVNGCGSASAVAAVTVETLASLSSPVSGPSSVCVGSAITLLDVIPGGVWSSFNANASLLAPGIVSGVTVGTDTIYYSVSNACGAAIVKKPITINPIPAPPAIGGPTAICLGAVATLTDGLASGSWTSSNPAVEMIDITTGIVTGVSVGNVTISYTVTNAFGCPNSVTLNDTVEVVPVLPAITGTPAECAGGATILADATLGGTWSSSDLAIATVDAAGNVNGVAAGTTAITYTVINICGSTYATVVDTVYSLPTVAAISGASTVCVGATATLSDASAGCVWSSSNTLVASVSATGVVRGVTAGSAMISATVTNAHGCQNSATLVVTVDAMPAVAAISGSTSECVSGTISLSDATGAGVWSSANPSIASVDATGIVTGVAAGITVISYTYTDALGCSATAIINDTVNTSGSVTPITGLHSICVGASTSLSDAAPSGKWFSADTMIAVIDSNTGAVAGVSAGTVIISYDVTGACGVFADTTTVTVHGQPSVAAISGPTAPICTGSSTSLTDATVGGHWSSTNTSVATVGATSGIVYGIGAGVIGITYTYTDAFGCSDSTGFLLNFGGSLGTASIAPSGTAVICHGSPVTLVVATSSTGMTYQWLKNDTDISGATSNNYTASQPGSYTAVVYNGTCEGTLTATTVINSTTPVIHFTAPNMLSVTGGTYATYQWFLDSTAIAGATASSYSESANGHYTCVVTYASGCADTSAVYNLGTGAAGVNVVGLADAIRIYPNPATVMLMIDAPIAIEIKVLSVDGRVLSVSRNTKSVDVSNLASGMYFIQVADLDGRLLKSQRFGKVD